LDLDFPFFVVYIGLNAEPKKKEKGKKKWESNVENKSYVIVSRV
jgi:hypothetical protein